MKNKLVYAVAVILALGWMSCNKCKECELSVQLEGQTQADIKSFSKCGSRKELKAFEEDLDSLRGVYGEEYANVTCVDTKN